MTKYHFARSFDHGGTDSNWSVGVCSCDDVFWLSVSRLCERHGEACAWTPVEPGKLSDGLAGRVGFIAVGGCIVLRWQGPAAATLLGVVLLLRAFFVYLFGLPMHIRDPFRWTSGFELISLGGAALVLAGSFPMNKGKRVGWRESGQKFFQVGRYLFAIGLVIFDVQHLMYAGFLAGDVPAWIPWKLFWAYFVGVAFFAAALSIATGKMANLAATLLGTMFLLWVIMLHIPRVAAAPGDGNEWTSEFVALAMGGASFLMASAFSRNKTVA